MPDRLAWFRRLRPWEFAPGAAILAAGLALAAATFGVTRWTGAAVAVGGAALLWAAWQKRRWGRGGTAPGIVRVDERRLAYMGPETGGLIEMDELRRIDFRPGPDGGTWILRGPHGAALDVPAGALGAETLLDLFASLPGLSVERLLAARAIPAGADADPGEAVTVWRRDAHLSVVR